MSHPLSILPSVLEDQPERHVRQGRPHRAVAPSMQSNACCAMRHEEHSDLAQKRHCEVMRVLADEIAQVAEKGRGAIEAKLAPPVALPRSG